MRIAILGTRGIPSQYGGFEKCAEHIALSLSKRGHYVMVYNAHNHPNQKTLWEGVHIAHVNDPEFKLRTFGRFVFDYNCIRDLRGKDYDIVLQLGYRSSPIWNFILPNDINLVTNMGGLEWKRPKYGKILSKAIAYAEKIAVQRCLNLVADSLAIQSYIDKKFEKKSRYIPYGAHVFRDPDVNILKVYNVEKFNYDLFIGNLEPENSLEMILDGVVAANTSREFIIIGNHLTKSGEYLKNKYRKAINIRFLGGIYDKNGLNNLRYFSNLYFHGHTLGGTNPLLLEAMACRSLISAHQNDFNRFVIDCDAFYFSTSDDVARQLVKQERNEFSHEKLLDNNIKKITNHFNWENVGMMYENFFLEVLDNRNEKVRKLDSKLAV